MRFSLFMASNLALPERGASTSCGSLDHLGTPASDQLRRGIAVLLRSAEWSCADTAHELGANRLPDSGLDDLADALESLAGVLRRYRVAHGQAHRASG